MRTTVRLATAALLAAPLVASTLAPANAASSTTIKDSGSYASVSYEGFESSDSIPGNYVMLGLDVYGNQAMGGGMAFDCPGTTFDESCTYLGDLFLDGTVTSTQGKSGTKSVTLSGDVNATIVTWNPDGSGDGQDLGTFPLQVTLTPTAKPATHRSTETYRDPSTGEYYSFRLSETVATATVSGSLDGLDLTGTQGVVGTYKMMSRQGSH